MFEKLLVIGTHIYLIMFQFITVYFMHIIMFYVGLLYVINYPYLECLSVLF